VLQLIAFAGAVLAAGVVLVIALATRTAQIGVVLVIGAASVIWVGLMILALAWILWT
jgi:hypothetical protein